MSNHDDLSPEQSRLFLEQIEAAGFRLTFLAPDGQVVTNHDKMRSLLSHVVNTAFLSAIGFAIEHPKGVFGVPGRVGSVVSRVRPQRTMQLPGGGAKVIPETLTVQFTASAQLKRHLERYHRERAVGKNQDNSNSQGHHHGSQPTQPTQPTTPTPDPTASSASGGRHPA